MTAKPQFSLAEVAAKNSEDERWVVIDGKVYDVTKWVKKHPGGRAVIANYGGEDCTEPFYAMHPDRPKALGYLKSLYIGDVSDYKVPEVTRDFRDMREKFEKAGLFKANYVFFLLHFAQLFVFELLAYLAFTSFPHVLSGWPSYAVGVGLLATAQAQAGWLQHDIGHFAVTRSSALARWAHLFVISFMKGASSKWWNYRHFIHHGKPNVANVDPDITLPYVFILGTKLPQEWGQKKKRGLLPYQFQHLYFHLLGPLTLLPGYFHYDNLAFVIKRKYWLDIAFMLAFFVRHHAVYVPLFGWGGSWALYFTLRSVESVWFVWVTQMSHLSMEVDRDHKRDWVSLQLQATCNVEPSAFNDWFTGHLNFQIEHHLFPTMPRHNYLQIQPEVKALCAKHKLKFTEKSLFTAFADVLSTLEASGQMWYNAFYHI